MKVYKIIVGHTRDIIHYDLVGLGFAVGELSFIIGLIDNREVMREYRGGEVFVYKILKKLVIKLLRYLNG